eukprot:scaffold90276_cov17-Tisochrysis_lutea.AAC.1
MHILVGGADGLADDEEGSPLEKYHLISVADLAQFVEVGLERGAVRDERVHHLRPGAVEGLVPDGGLEASNLEIKFGGHRFELRLPLPEDLLALFVVY